MAIRQIRIVGDPVLRKKSKKLDTLDPLTLQLMEDMAETMYEAPGVGLAAPQVGINKRVIVVDVGQGLYKMVNPRIIESEGAQIDTEGCLSVPDKVGDVERFTRIMVKYMDENGKYEKIEALDFFARALQHEIDHLDGILYIDKASNIREPEYPGEGEEIPEEYDEEMAYEESDGDIPLEAVSFQDIENQEPAIFETRQV